jgi:hypothetical protein
MKYHISGTFGYGDHGGTPSERRGIDLEMPRHNMPSMGAEIRVEAAL